MVTFPVTGGCWPTPQQELLLRAALLQGDSCLSAWRQWKAEIDLDFEHPDPESFRLLPSVYRSLQSQGVDDPLLGRLKGVYRRTWYQNQRLFRSAGDALRTLEQAGIRTLMLDAAALILLYYHDRGLRIMDEFAVLVPRASMGLATETLLLAGWQSSGLPEEGLDESGVFPPPARRFQDDQGQTLRLYERLLLQGCDSHDNLDVWAAAVPLQFDGVASLALCPADQLVHTNVQRLLYAQAVSAGWVADTMAVLGGSAREVDWNRLVEQAEKLRLVLLIRRALRYLSEAFGANILAEPLRELEALPVAAAERREFHVLTGPQGLLGSLPQRWLRFRRHLWQYGESGSMAQDLWRFLGILRYQEGHGHLGGVALWMISRGGVRLRRGLATMLNPASRRLSARLSLTGTRRQGPKSP